MLEESAVSVLTEGGERAEHELQARRVQKLQLLPLPDLHQGGEVHAGEIAPRKAAKAAKHTSRTHVRRPRAIKAPAGRRHVAGFPCRPSATNPHEPAPASFEQHRRAQGECWGVC